MAGDKFEARPVGNLALDRLLLDEGNPRFAGALGDHAEQELILEYLAQRVGLRDLLSSMAASGCSRASVLLAVDEPGHGEPGQLTVIEGNRRLATALILMGDPRARGFERLRERYEPAESARDLLETLPVAVFDSRDEVQSYLGITHIVGNKKWSSLAKAAWAANLEDKGTLGNLREIARLIGDQHGALERLVRAYRIVSQLKGQGRFDPDDTKRPGRDAPYPFSWLYTALGYTSVKEYIAFDPNRMGGPIPETHLGHAANLLNWMFGKESTGIEPAIKESRELGDLAAALTDDRQLALLNEGHSVADAREDVKPTKEKVNGGLVRARRALEGVNGTLASTGREIPVAEARQLTEESLRVKRAATQAHRTLRDLVDPPDDDED